MKFKASKDELSRVLGRATRVVSQGDSMRILKNILIDAKKPNTVTVTATTTEMTVVCRLKAKVDVAGQATIPAQVFHGYVSRIPSADLTINAKAGDQNQIEIAWAKNAAHIKRDSKVDEFPLITTVDKAAKNKLYDGLDKQIFKKALNNVLFAIDKNNDRLILAGGYLYNNKDKKEVLLVGTDSYRLSEHTIGAGSTKETKPVLIPGKTLDYIKSTLDDDDEKITIYADQESSQILFDLGDIMVTSRTIAGTYPDYQPLLPADDKFQTKIKADCATFLKHINLAGTLCEKEGSKTVVLDCQAGDKPGQSTLGVNPLESQVGHSNVVIEDVEISGGIKINFNYTYIRQVLEQLCQTGAPSPEPNVVVGIADAQKPCIFIEETLINGQKTTFRHAIMPVRP